LTKKSYPIHIRFNDIDVIGHVNNAIYLSYFEEARKDFFNELIDMKWDWSTEGTLLARNELDYKVPIHLEDEARIEIWVSRIGNKSLDISYRIVKNDNGNWVECTVGKSVVVCFNYKENKTIEIPEKWRVALEVGG